MKKLLILLPVLLLLGGGCGTISPTINKLEYKCGEKPIKEIEIICKDGREGCSKKIILEGGGVAIFTKFQRWKTNENGFLCIGEWVEYPNPDFKAELNI